MTQYNSIEFLYILKETIIFKLNYDFIALIHPIQWTIAYPVGADRPAKRQKKTSCVSIGQAGPVLCPRQMACCTSFLFRQSDVIASFLFGAWLCTRKILLCQIFCFLHRTFYFSDILSTYLFCINNMASPSQRRGKCGHAMALFDTHTHCARCREKGQDFCVENPTSADKCPICITFTSDQRLQLATPAYKIKKEKREAKTADSTPSKDEELVDPASVAVIGAVDNQGTIKTSVSAPPPDKKPKKESKKDTKKVKSPSSTASTSQPTTDGRFNELDNKWSERFSRLEALILAKSFEPSFTSDVKVAPSHSPPQTQNITEPFIRPSTSLPGSGFSAEKHQPTSKAITSSQTSSNQFTGTGFSATKHQPASQTKSSRPASTVKFTGQGSSATPHQPASQTKSHRPSTMDCGTDPQDTHRPLATDRSLSSDPADTGSPALHQTRRDSVSSAVIRGC